MFEKNSRSARFVCFCLFMLSFGLIGQVFAGGEYFSVGSDGNIGINSTVPNSKLDVGGSLKASGNVSFTASGNSAFSVLNGNIGIGTAIANKYFRMVKAGPEIQLYNTDSTLGSYLSLTNDTNEIGGVTMGGTNWDAGHGSALSARQMMFNNSSNIGGFVWTVTGGITERLRLTNDGNLGIGSVAPSAMLDVAGPARISTSLATRGNTPTLGSGAGDCGTSPSITGNDIAGAVTVGSGTNGGKCTITFSAAKSATPHCFCQDRTTASLIRATNPSTTSVECSGALTAGDVLDYLCIQ